MDTDDIDHMVALMERHGLVELEWERDGTRVRLRKPEGTAGTPPRAADSGQVQPERILVHAPILGTFYRATGPEGPPCVSVGDRVKRGDVLCIIEAMKLMNEVKAEVDGEILEVFVESGAPVQFGERLFAIRTQPAA
ncbi:MAG: acetyl-CoA carboxylase, biotin carboxyl carrier protein [Acidobacteria bacterium]|nr:acetyl-CoA carboxylase, biotin carboxyl carrier protein [Acidobacteriota bacterium]